jgi:arginine deiminase
MQAGARAEWDPLRHVMVHEPGIEVFFALLSPWHHLYERFFDQGQARREHRQLCDLLHGSFGVRVHRLIDMITEEAVARPEIREQLVSLAASRIHAGGTAGIRCEARFTGATEGDPLALRLRDPAHLVRIVLLDPRLDFTRDHVQVSLGKPLHNLYFMRDQQAATDRGICMGRMATAEREGEVALCGLGLDALGITSAARVRAGRFEGGDFLPAGDVAFIGKGSRTDARGVEELLDGVGVDEVVVVEEPVHPLIHGRDPMVCMHLDTYVNFPAEGVAVGCPLLLRAAKVTVLHREGNGYVPARGPGDLESYLREKGMDLVEISTLEQLCFATNFLCIRSGTCITPDTEQLAPLVLSRLREKAACAPEKYGSLLRQAEHEYTVLSADAEFFPHSRAVHRHGLEMTPLMLTNATGGYGGAHCMTCTLSR